MTTILRILYSKDRVARAPCMFQMRKCGWFQNFPTLYLSIRGLKFPRYGSYSRTRDKACLTTF